MQEQDPYNFILNPQQPQKRPGAALLQNPKQRLLAGVAFVCVVLMIVIIGINILFSAGRQNNDALISLNAYQTEILRVADIGLKDATDPNTKALVTTLQSFMTSDQANLREYLSRIGVDLKPEQITAQQDTSLDSTLETAAQRNNYDETLLSILNDLQAAYRASLRTALNETTTPNRQELLDVAANNIVVYENK